METPPKPLQSFKVRRSITQLDLLDPKPQDAFYENIENRKTRFRDLLSKKNLEKVVVEAQPEIKR